MWQVKQALALKLAIAAFSFRSAWRECLAEQFRDLLVVRRRKDKDHFNFAAGVSSKAGL